MGSFFKTLQAATASKLFRAWVTATVGSFFLAALVVGLLHFLFLSGPAWLAHSLAYVSVLVGGLIVGACQWVLLRRKFRRAYWWIVATGLGTFAGPLIMSYAVMPALNVFADPSVWAIAPLFENVTLLLFVRAITYGLSLGIAQWLFFRSRVAGSAEWISWVVLASCVTSLTGFIGPNWEIFEVVMRDSSDVALYYGFQVLQIVLNATIYAALPGLALIKLVRQVERSRREALS